VSEPILACRHTFHTMEPIILINMPYDKPKQKNNE
jgi:hypothetical protein